jgi:uncharacterized protein YjbI with pentapeptide repeats
MKEMNGNPKSDMDSLIADLVFDRLVFSAQPLEPAEYDNCRFNQCDFSYAGLGKYVFTDCQFNACTLSLANLYQTGLRNIDFTDCKMLGIHFNTCSDFLFSVRFEKCILDMSVFSSMKLKNIRFSQCSLKETDFTEADLSGVAFDQCDLDRGVFDQTNLEKTDFRTAFHFSINPARNRVRKAKFSLTGLLGLLDTYDLDIS